MNIISLGIGKCSSFGGSDDGGVAPLEGLGLVEIDDLSEWWFSRCFSAHVGIGHTIGLARCLNQSAFYCAMRFAYASFDGIQGEILSAYSREQVRRLIFMVGFNGKFIPVQAVDWGPNLKTGRLIDMSPGGLTALGARTDDELSVSVIIP